MAEPIEYRILLDLQAALRRISVQNGFFYDLADLAVKLDPNHGVEALIDPDGLRPFVVLEPKPELWDYGTSQETAQVELSPGVFSAADQVFVTLPIMVHWIQQSNPTVDESKMQTFFRGCADVEQAIARNVSRDGLAIHTRVTRRTYDEIFDSAQVWAMIELDILIYRTLGAPNA